MAPAFNSKICSFCSKSIASALHAFLQLPHFPLLRYRQYLLSIKALLGIACGNGMDTAGLVDNPSLYSSGMGLIFLSLPSAAAFALPTGQTARQEPHPVHLSSLT